MIDGAALKELTDEVISEQNNKSSYVSVKGKKWDVSLIDERKQIIVEQKYDIPDIVARLLISRNVEIEYIKEYLNPTLRFYLPNPWQLRDMKNAANRLAEAIINNEKLLIFGDYDVDGATSSALLKRFFNDVSLKNSEIYIPNRFTEGYGPSVQAFEKMLQEKIGLVITVDCGTAAIETINKATKDGLEIIIVDHHLGGEILPNALAIVNPNRFDETSEFGYLAAVGVTFLLIVATNSILRERGWFESGRLEPNLLEFLDIVALGTVCDVVPMIGLNRAFVKQGLKILSKRKNLGLTALIDVAGIKDEINPYHLGYIVGPRINAGGRIGKSWLGARLLSSNNREEVYEIAEQLEILNQERRAIETITLEEAMMFAEQSLIDKPYICIVGNSWHQGVIGIVASRLKDKFDKLVIVISIENNIGKASCRSIKGVDIGALVMAAKLQGILINGGGHAMAAGFTVTEEKIEIFKEFITKELNKIPEFLAYDYRTHFFEGCLSSAGVTLELAQLINQLGPYGADNPIPKFMIQDIRIVKINVMANKHISCLVSRENNGATIRALLFHGIETTLGNFLLTSTGKKISIIGNLQISKWQGEERVEILIHDVIFKLN